MAKNENVAIIIVEEIKMEDIEKKFKELGKKPEAGVRTKGDDLGIIPAVTGLKSKVAFIIKKI